MLMRRFSSLPTWTPFREMDVRREMERLFDGFASLADFHGAGVFPALNVSETSDAIVVRAELPGFDPEKLDVTVENNTLTLAGSRERQGNAEGVSYHRREREWGAFRRSVTIPTRVAGDKVRATYTDGILTVEMPKAAEARPKQITVQTGA